MTQLESNHNIDVDAPKPNLFKVLFQPGELKKLNDNPVILVPGLILTLIVAISGLITTKGLIDSGFLEQQLGGEIPIENIKVFSYIGAVLGGIFSIWLAFLILAGILRLFSIFIGSQVKFKTLFSLSMFTYGVIVLQGLLVGTLALIMGVSAVDINLGLGVFVSEKTGFISAVLSSITIFTVWWYYLLSVGYSEVAKISLKKSFLVIGIISLIFLLIIGGLGTLSSMTPQI
ncbi:hypothetical protein BHF71_08650 [Vulcanibacillus modesticaldus]|uniref:Yip1 domain-containing protein n=1 Tax=Vulcanibacillus modesticaldus TaxID=337097 RepID=A0A1D2YV54_9BACI|nr:YIP1 family protein [Vulcanibacillus modesticaldus]OEF99541.1 hypothetical protein BHF71_08650 [Vulcanibacillus modesticaldus]